jgi:hypothetical protein
MAQFDLTGKITLGALFGAIAYAALSAGRLDIVEGIRLFCASS